MEVHELVEGYYTVILNTDDKISIMKLTQAWDAHGVDVISWLLVRSLNDAIAGLDKGGRRPKGKKHGDKG